MNDTTAILTSMIMLGCAVFILVHQGSRITILESWRDRQQTIMSLGGGSGTNTHTPKQTNWVQVENPIFKSLSDCRKIAMGGDFSGNTWTEYLCPSGRFRSTSVQVLYRADE